MWFRLVGPARYIARRVSFPLPSARLSREGPEVLSTMTAMTSSKRVQRAARRRGEGHRDGGDPRVPQVIAPRHRLNTGRVGDAWIHGLSRKPIRDGATHALAIRRLEAAVDDRQRVSRQDDAVRGTSAERDAVVELAAANEQLAAREAWVKYIEHGY